MASNTFGTLFRYTTWGESHGPAVGVIIDGCPAGLDLCIDKINLELKKRAPGQHRLTSPRKEQDKAELLSGVYNGKTTGAPISILIKNNDVKSSSYTAMQDVYRPGHANYTYLKKYGIMDQRGGGRASARETAARVAAGAVADCILQHHDITVAAYMHSIGQTSIPAYSDKEILASVNQSPLYIPEDSQTELLLQQVEQARSAGDSVGGVVACRIINPCIGLGEPVYDKLEAKLAYAMLSIPASKGFEIGKGFSASQLRGSQHNDGMYIDANKPAFASNHAGGTLGGISTGETISFNVAFKPTSSIKQTQSTVNTAGEDTTISLPKGSRHDPCVAIRAIPVVAAMAKCVIADCILMQQTTTLGITDKS